MNKEIQFIKEQLKDAWEGEPWFGSNGNSLLERINEANAFERPAGQHSVLDLVWHMVNWKEFTISRLKREADNVKEYDENDWRELNHNEKSLLKKGIERLQKAQQDLLQTLAQQNDDILDQQVDGRSYNYRKLLHGICQHDIYHLGQIAYIIKML